MTASKAKFIDPTTGQRYELAQPRWRAESGAPLMTETLPGISRDDIDRSSRTLWRYAAALPVEIARPVSLGEGCTPMVERTVGGCGALFKLEWFSPTCSFKDKGASVMVSFLRQLGIPAILEDSSGNGGAAIAAYGAAAGMKVRVLAPESASPAKIAQMRVFGAEVQLVPGPRDASEREALRQAEEIFYASHNWHPFFLQGTKMTAYEIWEDLGFRAPDNVIITTGAGSNVLGCDIGFSELLAAGQIDRLPRLFGAQPAHCAPIAASYRADSFDPIDIAVAPTIAEGASIRFPVRLRQVLEAVRRSDGRMLAVSEDEISTALFELAGMGLFVEPTSAVAHAAFRSLLAAGEIGPGETTVVLLSGSGIKSSAFVQSVTAA
ncbi:threonine synthase [Sphingomonas colocasiae]|uniref:Pyridoxal-phosphate dependent enzyme n=1 Tax=Sphingomonas colocasiae TaxID=1848973 RepID=A0ABS7PPP3_9SPHN|nr:pyridoxal-phosphate dependent enzyme [Sphingomonas colocasiae]MBY8823283.1 pyridoxal-phosphate dependent enzyme [Sphingomonas colocasiae]